MIKFAKLNKDLFKIKELKNQSNAILIYTAMLDLLQLSKKNPGKYRTRKGYYIIYTPNQAFIELGIPKTTFNKNKKLLKNLGLIDYDKQLAKTAGFSTPIYVTEDISHLVNIKSNEIHAETSPEPSTIVVSCENECNDNISTNKINMPKFETDDNSSPFEILDLFQLKSNISF